MLVLCRAGAGTATPTLHCRFNGIAKIQYKSAGGVVCRLLWFRLALFLVCVCHRSTSTRVCAEAAPTRKEHRNSLHQCSTRSTPRTKLMIWCSTCARLLENGRPQCFTGCTTCTGAPGVAESNIPTISSYSHHVLHFY